MRYIGSCTFFYVLSILLFSTTSFGQCNVNLGNDLNSCPNDPVQLGANISVTGNTGPVTYSWTNGAAAVANPTVTPANSTTYIVTVTAGGCQPGGVSDNIVVNMFPVPTASFSFTPNNACSGTTVNFTSNVSNCSGCQYLWNFNDPSSGSSNTSTVANPSHVFNAFGNGNSTFNVSLTVTAANGCDVTVTQVVTVRQVPNVILLDPFFEVESFLLCDGTSAQSVTVSDGSIGNVTNYSINWGDGAPVWTSTTAPSSMTHQYAVGVFNLAYTLTGTNNCSVTETYPVYNISNPELSTGSSGGTQSCGPVEFCFNLSGFSNNHSSTTYEINYGDGSPSFTVNHPPNPQYCHSYTTTHCPTTGFIFAVTAVNGCSETPGTVGGIKVGAPPISNFTANPQVQCVNIPINFVNNSTPGYNYINCSSGTTYTWDFGDGSPTITVANTSNQSHAYSTPGNYTVTLTANHQQCGSHILTRVVCIQASPVAAFTVNSPLCLNGTAVVNNTSVLSNTCSNSNAQWTITYSPSSCTPNTGAYTYTSGTSGASVNPQLLLQSAGTYTLSYSIQSACPTVSTNQQVVVNTAPVVDVNTPANGVCAGTSGTPTATVNACNLPITNYAWTFTNGSPTSASTATAPAVTYANAGNHNVTLSVTNACGTTTDVATMQVLNIPDVQITATNNDLAICQGQPTTLTATGAATYTWSPSTYLSNYSTSGNTVTSTPTAGITYTVTGTSGSCTDTGTITLTVDPLPVVTTTGTFALCIGETEQLGVNVTGGTTPYASYSWSPNVGLSANNISNPVFSGTSTTNYNVSVTDNNGCSGTANVPVTVNPLPNVNAGPDINMCNQPVPTQLTGFSPTTGGIGAWSGNNVTPGGVYTPAGNGSDTLQYCFQVTATGCSACDERIITVSDPTGANGGPDTTRCLNGGALQLPAGTWSGSSLVSSSGLFTPSVVGPHTLTVQQGTGSCQTTDQVVITVLPLPIANAGSDTTICVGGIVNLNSICATCPNGPIDICSWTGGPVANPLLCATTTSPIATTTYTLTIIDDAGCTDTDQKTVFVNPLPPTNAGSDLILCNQPMVTQLNGTPAGGTWTGTGVTSAGAYTPTGTGTFVLTYSYTNPLTLCNAIDNVTIQVNDPVVANAGPDVTLCQNEGIYQLTGFAPTVGGTWSGTGVINAGSGIIQSQTAGVGTHVLTLTTGSGTCLTSDQMELTILPIPLVAAGPGATMCGNAAIFNLSGFVPITGGTWEGPGITNPSVGTFNPALGGTNNSLLYWYEDATTGCSDTAYTTVIVNSAPVANFNLDTQGCTNSSVVYTNTSVGGNSYIWRFGNGTEVNGFQPTYTYSNSGIFQITQIVENLAGCRDTAVNTTEIINPPIAHLVLSTIEGCAPLYIPFDNHSVGQYMSYSWNLGTATSTDSLPAAITYQQGADVLTYPISLTVTNYCGSDTDDATVTILPQPQASFGTNLDAFCSPFPVLLNNTSTGLPDTFEWDFGDGSFSSVEEPTAHNYYTGTENTDYTIWLYLENECGRDTANYTITVWPNTITGFFNTNVLEGCEPLAVEFTDHSDGATQISYYLGDGYGYTSDDNPSQIYTEGQYTIYQYADNGCSYDTTSITITVYDAPDIDFTTNISSSCTHNAIHFIPEPDDAVELFWDFDDGNVSGLSNPIHEYEEGGTYNVTLTGLSDNGCTTIVQHPINIVAGPEASFSVPDLVGCSPFQVCFSNSTTAGNFYTWNFGDGNTGNGQAPCHTYQNVGSDALPITIQMIAQDIQLCADTFEVNIIIAPQPISSFTLSGFDPCIIPQTLYTTNLSQFANGYEWVLENETISSFTNTAVTFENIDEYVITLIATNQFGCSSSSNTTYTISDLPVAMLNATPRQGCVPLTVQFNNISSEATDYVWNLGNGLESNDVNPVFTYNNVGNYDITLTAYNDVGCTDALYLEDYIRVFGLPIANFWADPVETDIYQSTIEFHNTSYNAYDVEWYFGDGEVSTEYDPVYTYSDAGIWPVTLTVWNMYGCKAVKRDVVIVNDIFDVFVPNTFTPDGDGVNEVFLPHISGKPFIHSYVFRIFDRWGTVIFETDDYDQAWTGDIRSGEFYAKDEVYNWQVVVHLKGSEEPEKYQGHVFVLR